MPGTPPLPASAADVCALVGFVARASETTEAAAIAAPPNNQQHSAPRPGWYAARFGVGFWVGPCGIVRVGFSHRESTSPDPL